MPAINIPCPCPSPRPLPSSFLPRRPEIPLFVIPRLSCWRYPFPFLPSHGLPYPQKSHKGQSRADRRAIQTFAPDHRPASARPPFLPPLHRNCDHENKVGDCVRGNLRERGRERGRKWSWLFTPFRSSRAKSNPLALVNAGIISYLDYDLIRYNISGK